ncbi:MAG: CsbD family protein [Ilumatobacteraceae bacterium]
MSGKTDKVKGKLKQAAGDLTGNRKLRREGKVDELAGKAKDGIDRVAKKFTPERGTE